MAITSPPKRAVPSPEAAAAFIGGAPDGQPAPAKPDTAPSAGAGRLASSIPADETPAAKKPRRGVFKGAREQITHTMPPGMLEQLSRAAADCGISRAAFMNKAISDAISAHNRTRSN